ncbi:MAG: acetate/propionate family kinase [Ruminococcaceae bacterium]|nr:acetate/propionate family kinase [Oscillospiraceae bacterium]
MNLLVCNAGSTSLKFQLYQMPEEIVLARGTMERVGDPKGGRVRYWGKTELDTTEILPDYETGIRLFLKQITGEETGVIANLSELAAVGFKTVLSRDHYGVHRIDEAVLQGMRDMLTVAPAHNKHYLAAIATFMKVLPDVPMVGVFETAFHQTMPPEAFVYSAPYEWYEAYGVRRFGYHGASHSYVADNLNEFLGPKYKAVSCHLGGSCSLCAIVDGKSVDTSFGLSLQVGLPQSNRSGDLDPFIICYMADTAGMSLGEIYETLEKKGGLLGISGVSGDLRDVELAAKEGNERAKLAVEIFCRELVRYIGGYAAVMGGLDAVVFTGGIGENSETVRGYVAEKLSFLGVVPDAEAPKSGIRKISADDSRVALYVIPANEELGVARKTYQKLMSK